MGDTSVHCDRREHEKCDGTAVIMDQDGASRYVCSCGCHNANMRERDCPNCKGTGRLHDERSYGRYSTEPGPIPARAGTKKAGRPINIPYGDEPSGPGTG